MTRSPTRHREEGVVTSEYAVGTIAAVGGGLTILLVVPAAFGDLWTFLMEARPQIYGGLW